MSVIDATDAQWCLETVASPRTTLDELEISVGVDVMPRNGGPYGVLNMLHQYVVRGRSLFPLTWRPVRHYRGSLLRLD